MPRTGRAGRLHPSWLREDTSLALYPSSRFSWKRNRLLSCFFRTFVLIFFYSRKNTLISSHGTYSVSIPSFSHLISQESNPLYHFKTLDKSEAIPSDVKLGLSINNILSHLPFANRYTEMPCDGSHLSRSLDILTIFPLSSLCASEVTHLRFSNVPCIILQGLPPPSATGGWLKQQARPEDVVTSTACKTGCHVSEFTVLTWVGKNTEVWAQPRISNQWESPDLRQTQESRSRLKCSWDASKNTFNSLCIQQERPGSRKERKKERGKYRLK